MDDSASTEKSMKESSAENIPQTNAMNGCTNVCLSEKKVKERSAYLQLFVNLETLDDSIQYFIGTEIKGETPVEPLLCTKCYKVFYVNQQEMGEHCTKCQATEESEFGYVCQKCYFQVDTMFEACLHDLEGSCEGEIELVRWFECSKINPIFVYGKYIKRFCQSCATQIFTNKRTIDNQTCKCCNSKLHYICVKCEKLFSKYLQAKYHLKTQCMRVTLTCAVPQCSFNTNLLSTLKRHIKNCHGKKKSYGCKLCSFKTNENKKMSKHLVDKHDEKDYYKCDVCPEWATQQKSSIRRHVSRYHFTKRERESKE